MRLRGLAAWVLAAASLCASWQAHAEGSAQTGIGQDLYDYDGLIGRGYATDIASASMYVDIVAAGEVINVSLCGATNADDLRIEVFAPSDNATAVATETMTESNVDCADLMNAPLTTPYRYETLEAGTYRLELHNEPNTNFKRFDITVTPDTATDPDPRATGGRLWAYTFGFNAGSFTASTDANYFALVPGGRPNTDYVWQLDLNNFAGFVYNLVANSLGLDAPNSGYSAPKAGNSVSYEFPMYVSYPEIADPPPNNAPTVENVRFVDSDGEDFGISPGGSAGAQDEGVFEFETDVSGTYAVYIDLTQDGVFGNAGDRLLLGRASPGVNQVAWDGKDAAGNTPPEGTYYTEVQVHMGEYHFIANDAEISGGGEDGLTIRLANRDGSLDDVQVYWDDVTLLNDPAATANTPEGASSATSAGRHTWGSFSPLNTDFGNDRFLDTYVYGLATTGYAASAIVGDDTPRTTVNGTIVADATSVPDDAVAIMVTDSDLNEDPAAIDTVFVDVINDVTGETEIIELSETSVGSGEFSGGFPTQRRVPGAIGADGDGVVETVGEDTLTIIYRDLASDYTIQSRTANHTVLTDTDADGIANVDDLDDDGDTIIDVLEGGGDSDGDGVIDSLDTDSDNDGVPDGAEQGSFPVLSGVDDDADGIDNAVDIDVTSGPDTNGNGVDDTFEPIDTDGDTVADYRDPDSDDDGIADVLEGDTDSDGDGIADYRDTDSDNDGLLDDDEDTRSPPLLGSDADNDGIDDALDVDVTGGTDSDGNGIDDAVEPTDTDGTGGADYRDIDSDDDGIADVIEAGDAAERAAGGRDSDGDGQPDFRDLDSDNDTLLDDDEDRRSPVLLGSDADADGIDDALDVDATGGTDSNSNGIDDALEPTNTDGTGRADYRDIDSDDDGIADVIEAGSAAEAAAGGRDTDNDGLADYRETDSDDDGLSDDDEDTTSPPLLGSDADNDGIDDALDVDVTGGIDSDGNGIDDATEPTSTDADGLADYRDTDSDGDGIPDAVEGTGDADNDGRPNRLETDSDDDGISDTDEAGSDPTAPVDTDNDGDADVVDTDSDDDGIDDADEGDGDADGDDIPDRLDDDSDNDGIADDIEGSVDTDQDGTPDYLDADSDDDGIDDATEGSVDSDGDGVADFRDPDSDNDGLSDAAEGTVNSDGDALSDYLDIDSDNDGIADVIEAGDAAERAAGGRDSDGDGQPDYLDLDSDNDTLSDDVEDTTSPPLLGSDADSDGVDDALDVDVTGGTDSDGNGIDDALEPTDTDGTGGADYRDIDSDDDGIADVIEAGDAAERAAGGRDSDGDGQPDFQDLDSDNDTAER